MDFWELADGGFEGYSALKFLVLRRVAKAKEGDSGKSDADKSRQISFPGVVLEGSGVREFSQEALPEGHRECT
jgi:hypothetical protein